MEIIFTQHAEHRITKRKISKEEVISSIKYPERLIKKHGKHYYQKMLDRGIIEVVCELTKNNIKIITIYWI